MLPVFLPLLWFTVTDNLCIVVEFRANERIWMERVFVCVCVCVCVMRWTDGRKHAKQLARAQYAPETGMGDMPAVERWQP